MLDLLLTLKASLFFIQLASVACAENWGDSMYTVTW